MDMKAITRHVSPFIAAASVALSIVLAPIAISFAADAVSQVSIAGNGFTIVRGATVEAVAGRFISARAGWNEAKMSWNIDTGSATKFFNADGERIALSDIRVGDIINFSGTMDSQTKKITVVANVVKDLSLTLSIVADETTDGVGIPNTGEEGAEQETSVLKQLVDWLRGTRGILSMR